MEQLRDLAMKDRLWNLSVIFVFALTLFLIRSVRAIIRTETESSSSGRVSDDKFRRNG